MLQIGGMESSQSVSNLVSSFNLTRQAWDEETAELVQARYCASACYLDHKVFVFGGITQDKTQLSSVEVLDTKKIGDTWSLINV